MNLDPLFYAASQTGDRRLYDAAVQHAKTTQRAHMRAHNSTIHLVEFDPATGDVKERLTNQGYTDISCRTRGQTWAIAGFVETYHWTRDDSFLTTAIDCPDYFLRRLPDSYMPPGDFDASDDAEDKSSVPPNVSATAITPYGLPLIHQAQLSRDKESFHLISALWMADAVCEMHLNPAATFVTRIESVHTVEFSVMQEANTLAVELGIGDTILNGATINNHEYTPRRWANHGLVYTDYYFLLFGNKLSEIGV